MGVRGPRKAGRLTLTVLAPSAADGKRAIMSLRKPRHQMEAREKKSEMNETVIA